MSATLIVTAPVVLAKDEQGAVQYIYKDVPLPAFVSAEDRKRFLDEGLVAEVEAPVVEEPVVEPEKPAAKK